jgi:hypothetical protein
MPMSDKTYEWFPPFLEYCSQFTHRPLKKIADLDTLSARELLTLADQLEDEHIPLLMLMIKSINNTTSIFEKLMGDHDEDHRDLVDSFFERYSEQVLADVHLEDQNPLEMFLPLNSWEDLVFLETRKEFFQRQTHETINNFLTQHWDNVPKFDSSVAAWEWFWLQVLQK